jgi:anti-sigma regulatory factor (Ser/Thr protein kinase)
MSIQTATNGTGATLNMRLPATANSLVVFRDGLRGWLEKLPLHPAEVFDVVLACSESLTLVIEESPRQVALVVDVNAVHDGDTLSVTTRDYGLWDASHAEDREEPLSMSLMRALMDSVELERHPDGQTIRLARKVRMLGDQRRRALLI